MRESAGRWNFLNDETDCRGGESLTVGTLGAHAVRGSLDTRDEGLCRLDVLKYRIIRRANGVGRMRLWTYATVERAEDKLDRRILAPRKWHECCAIQFDLAIVDDCTTQPDGCRLSDCFMTTLGEKRQISPKELRGDWNPADRLFR